MCQMSEIDCSCESLYNLGYESSANQSDFRHSSAYVCPSALSLHKHLLNEYHMTCTLLALGDALVKKHIKQINNK